MENEPGVDAGEIAARVEHFVREVVVPYETDTRSGAQGPTDNLVQELRGLARQAGLMTPHILANGRHLSQRDTAGSSRVGSVAPLVP